MPEYVVLKQSETRALARSLTIIDAKLKLIAAICAVGTIRAAVKAGKRKARKPRSVPSKALVANAKPAPAVGRPRSTAPSSAADITG